MKKALLSLLAVVMFIPSMMGQSKTESVFMSENKTVCGAYTWLDGNTYANDTVVMYTSQDTVYVLSLTVHNNIDTAEVREVTGTCSYKRGNKVWNEEGTYLDTLMATSANACDTVVKIHVTLTGIDSTNQTITACDTFLAPWGEVLTVGGNYDTIIISGNCERHDILNLTLGYSHRDTVVNAIEAGCSYQWNGTTIADTLIHVVNLYTAVGHCDSIAAIQLTLSGEESVTDNAVLCGNTTYSWHGRTFNAAAQADTTINVNGCPTHYHLNLTVGDIYDTITRSSCAQYIYTYDSRTGTPGQQETATFTASGLYSTDTNGTELLSRHWSTGCISHHTLNLTIVEPQLRERDFVVDTAVCDKYTFTVGRTSVTFDTDTTYTLTHYAHGSNGATNICYDSVGSLNLTIKHSTVIDTTVTVCDTFYWDITDTYYTVSGTDEYRDTVLNEDGCSIKATLKLTVNYTPHVTIEGNINLTPGQSTTLTAVSNDNNVTYAWYKGASTAVASTTNTLALENVTANTDIHLVTVSNKGCQADNWITVTSNNLGIDEAGDMEVTMYPNPTARELNIESAAAIAEVVIYNINGQQVMRQRVDDTHVKMDLGNLAAGQYAMRVIAKSGEQTAHNIIVAK